MSQGTSDRILVVALETFGDRGYAATSLDAIATELGISKQSVLYWFPTKEALLEAVIAKAASELIVAFATAIDRAGDGFAKVEAVVTKAFRLGARRPELFGILREASRIGPPAATQLIASLSPLLDRATTFLGDEMAAGRMRRSDPALLVLTIYSTVLGMILEVEVLAALGEEPTARSVVKRRRDVIELLRSALLPKPPDLP